MSDPEDVRRLVASAVAGLGGLTILVCNAGVYGPNGPIAQTDWSEWVRAVEINLFGSVLPARAVAPHFAERGYGKIVQLSGGGATGRCRAERLRGLQGGGGALRRDARGELREHRVDVNAVAPGALNTRMLDEVLAAGPERVGESFYERALSSSERGGDSAAAGSRARRSSWVRRPATASPASC